MLGVCNMRKITTIASQKDRVCEILKECGFEINNPSNPPKIYPDLYGNDCLCILAVDKNPGSEESLDHHRIATYKLQELLKCKVLIGTLENIMVPRHRPEAERSAISLFDKETAIIEHYNKLCGKEYWFKEIDLEEEKQILVFSDSDYETLKATTTAASKKDKSEQKVSTGNPFTLYGSKSPAATDQETSSRESACQYKVTSTILSRGST